MTLAAWTAMDALKEAVYLTNVLFLSIIALQNLLYLAQLILAGLELRRHMLQSRRSDAWWMLTSGITMPISILAPAFNEEATIEENIRSLLALEYPECEIIIINDGSKDQTLQKAIAAFKLTPVERAHQLSVPHKQIRGLYGNPTHPRLLVVDKENGGKSDALNAGINLARSPLICAVDADSLLDTDALLRVVRPFIDDPQRMIAAGGRIRIVNGCKVRGGQVVEHGIPREWIPRFQTVEYTRAFLMARLAWSRLNAMLIISGAFGLFRRSAAIAVGGYSHGTVGEDMEIVTKMHRHFREHNIPYRMRYVPDPVCWTESPASLKILRRQRSRWQRGMMETLWKHRRMIASPAYGAAGLVGLTSFFLFDVIGPIVELAGYVLIPLCWAVGMLSYKFFLSYLMLTFMFGVFISVASLFLEEATLKQTEKASDLCILTLSAVVENFGYRQLNNFWRLEGIWQFITKKQGWGTMTRAGFQKSGAK